MSSETPTKAQDVQDIPPPAIPPHRGVKFWGTFACLCLLAFISALDVSVISIALPTITADIGGARKYVWIANSFVIASSVLQPLFGQLANVFGRRAPLISSVLAFALGTGIAGGAHTANMFIAGRTIQGAGAGGVYVLLDIVCCDLVPLRERGKFLGLMFAWSGVAAGLGPPIGGALAQADWRWIFWMQLPICGLALGGLLVFMQVGNGAGMTRGMSVKAKLGRLDVVGNLIFTPSMIFLLLGLVQGGIQHPWGSWRIVVPMVLGIVGWMCFHVQQFFVNHPSIPTHLFTNRTSSTAYLLTFTSSILFQGLLYFLPIYFQAVKTTTPLRSATLFLPFAIGTLVFAVVAGALLATFGKYKPLHAFSFAFTSVAFGLCTLLDAGTSQVAYVLFQLVAAIGLGSSMSVLLPAIMAPLEERDVATATATYSFTRTFGYIWGVTISSITFNSAFEKNLRGISDSGIRAQLQGGAGYAFASRAHALRNEIGGEVWGEVSVVYVKSLKAIWWVSLGVSVFSFFAVGLERSVKLRNELETEYGIEEKKSQIDEEIVVREAKS